MSDREDAARRMLELNKEWWWWDTLDGGKDEFDPPPPPPRPKAEIVSDYADALSDFVRADA